MRRSSSFHVALPVLVGLLALAAHPADAQTRKSKSQPSIARKAASARARAVSTPRVAEDTNVPRYKVDASGDLVPDLRAAAAIIYNPHTNQVLWEENSQDQRSIAMSDELVSPAVLAAFSKDGTHLAARAREDNRLVKIWDTGSAVEPIACPGHTMPVSCVRFSADNRRLVDSLKTAVMARNLKWLDENEKLIESRHIDGKLLNPEYEALESILRKAKAGDWATASEEVQALAKGQAQ